VKNCEGIQRQRLINKFTENDHEKIDRLMELHFKYLDRVNKADDKIEQKKRVSFCSSVIYCNCLFLIEKYTVLIYFFFKLIFNGAVVKGATELDFVLNLVYLTIIFNLFYLALEQAFSRVGNEENFLEVLTID